MNMRNKRKNYFIKKGFQSKLTVIILLMVVIVANLVGGIIYGVLTGNEISRYLANLFSVQSTDLLLPVIIISEFIAVLIVTIIGIFISHSMAGPIYRFEKVLNSMAEGELDFRIQLRSSDEFHELQDGINSLILVLNKNLGEIKEIAAEMKIKIEKENLDKDMINSLTRMETLLDHFKTVDDLEMDSEMDSKEEEIEKEAVSV
jgi:methyl-accepting chemotaxis protein